VLGGRMIQGLEIKLLSPLSSSTPSSSLLIAILIQSKTQKTRTFENPNKN
jgi:hypothetical protein